MLFEVMAIPSRAQQLNQLFPDLPSYRKTQMIEALFSPLISGWNDISNLPKAMKETLAAELPWMSTTLVKMDEGNDQDVFKATLGLAGGHIIETVLMKNRREAWTVCVSSQVGCAMRCAFCATGKLGLTRSLLADEIIDQYRFWVGFLKNRADLSAPITNIVFMGMGEPMANYHEVRDTLNLLLTHTRIGKTHITVSSVGVLPRLEEMLNDEQWPHVRMAISLHSAHEETRMKLMPSSYTGFHERLEKWAHDYLEKFGNRRHHLTFEYVMLHGVNDTKKDAQELASYANRIENVRVNLIPYNVTGAEFQSSKPETIEKFKSILESCGVTVTIRKSFGTDFNAACGQLAGTSTPNVVEY
jgi:23S rRNA (adenine2503-C2)-methyltransferase